MTKMPEFKIEKIPVETNSGGRGKWPFKDMKVGESFIVPNEFMDRVRSASCYYGARNKMKFSVKRQLDGSHRCGRVK